jgi:thiosulfate/3-mercaptopyruvate sulfurtransferase
MPDCKKCAPRVAGRPILALSLLSLLVCTSAAAASPRDSIVVGADWLAKHLSDPKLVLLHVGDESEYQAKHIPGARLISLHDVSISDHSKKGLILEMPPPEDLRHRLESFGISDDSRVVVYYGNDWVTPSTRILFTLDYAGLGANASILDGGMGAWVRNGGAVTKEVPPPRMGKLAPLKIRPIVVDAAFVRSHLGKKGFAVVDGRASVYYDGLDSGGSSEEPQRTGHIAGAGSVPFPSITDDNLMLRSPAEWEALLAKGGVKPGDTVIGYCHIGMQTTAVLLAARTLGHPVLLYDGSFQDWSRHTEYPVDNPAAGKK